MAIEVGDTVRVHYTGRLETGDVFDSSEGKDPLEFQVGAGQLIPGFDQAVQGLSEGDKTTITIPPEEGYGPRSDEMVRQVPKEQLGAEEELTEGQVLGLQTEDGRQFQATVKEVGQENVTLDFNHFLAGETLVFDIEVVAVS